MIRLSASMPWNPRAVPTVRGRSVRRLYSVVGGRNPLSSREAYSALPEEMGKIESLRNFKPSV